MCGIAGIIDFRGGAVDPAQLREMSDTIAHRGPDDEGYLLIDPGVGRTVAYSGAQSDARIAAALPDIRSAGCTQGFSIGFAHRRFSIIDLTHAGHQPFIAPHGGWSIAYNGEIYNYRELRRELESLGWSFISACDTEVALYAYITWGVKCFDRFNGFWAMAIFDPQEGRVVLSRDRLGVKPLYYAERNGRIVFASEIKALLALPEIRAAASPEQGAINAWLRSGIKDHAGGTFFTGIRPFPAGSWAVAASGLGERVRRFWSLPLKRLRPAELPIEKATADLRTLLTDAIRLRLRADVPLAVSLSGGIDSSALIALAKHELDVSLPSFTVRFPDPAADESSFAAAVAAACGSQQTWIDAPAGSFWRDIAAFTALHDEPYHAPNMHADQQVWSAMRGQGIKVALNGAAGDENFGGYGYHYSLMQLRRLKRGDIVGYFNEARRCSDVDSRLEAFLKPVAYALKERLLYGNTRSLDLDARLWQDMQLTLMPYWLSAGDRNYMGLPIEIREPFLDYRMVEFAFALPLEYLERDGWQKWIVRKTLEPYLPHDVVWRKRKMGFPFPYGRFFSESGEIIRLIAASSTCPLLKSRPGKRWHSEWMSISYLLWYEWFVNHNTALFEQIRELAPGEDVWPVRPAYLG
jgi:asparagine synthase (glutamine-hydrolysing)